MKVLSNKSYCDQAYDYIKEMIITKQFKPGDKIPEQSIVNQLGISRTPVREAIKKLSNDGLVVIFPNKYSKVSTIDDLTMMNLMMLRMSIENISVQLAIYHGSNSEFAELRSIADKCLNAAKNNDIYNRIIYDSEFHLKIAEIGKNEMLYEFQKKLHLRIQLWQSAVIKEPDEIIDGVAEHSEIVEKLINRNRNDAVDIALRHLQSSYERYLKKPNEKTPFDYLSVTNINKYI